MEDTIKPKLDLHKFASSYIQSNAKHVAKSRSRMIVNGIDDKIDRHNAERRERAFSFLDDKKPYKIKSLLTIPGSSKPAPKKESWYEKESKKPAMSRAIGTTSDMIFMRMKDKKDKEKRSFIERSAAKFRSKRDNK